ncbi:cationic amino acid transporter 2-like [Asterias rubens]|uniref:cationic amino acid transporter 2-like n=1 Tax=Asterias rubens TaxID=7604 RepID=UPI001455A7A5|nr:cationic amino acid transporter 2-like [Asterias rubens]
MGDRVGSPGHLCRCFLASISRRKQVPHPPTCGGEVQSSSAAGLRCVPCKLARYGVGHGGSLAIGVFVIVGYVTGEVAGPSALLSLVIASIACLISGYCYAEYTSHYPTRSLPATAYHYVYMLSGEFPAAVVGWSQIITYIAVSSLLGRNISFTFDYLIGYPIQNFTASTLADTTTQFIPKPDFLAFGVVMCVAFLVAFGGKPASLSNAVFNVLSCCVVIAIIVLAGIQLAQQNVDLDAVIFPEGHKGVFQGVALTVFLFSNYDVISTSSKRFTSSPSQTSHALAISSILNLVFYLVVGMFCLLVAPFPWTPVDPFLPSLFKSYWGKGAMYAIGISIIVCLGSALFNNMCSLVYSVFLIGNDGLAFRFLGKLVSRLQSPLYSALIVGVITGTLSIIFQEDVLLELMAIGLLIKQVAVCTYTLSYRYVKVKLDLNENSDLEEILKNGHAKQPDEAEAKTKTVQRNGGHHHRHQKHKSKEKNKRGVKSEERQPTMAGDASQINGKTVHFLDDTSDSSGVSDIGETDIDAIVEEYQERARIASMTHFENPNNHNNKTKTKSPSAFSSAVAVGFSVVVWSCATITSAILTFRLSDLIEGNPWTIAGLVVFVVTALLSLLVIAFQPHREVKPAFQTSLFPLLPFVGIFLNVFLMFSICAEAWTVFGVCIFVGLAMYFCYGICNSVEARRFSIRHPDEERILLPSIPEQAMHEEFLNGQKSKRRNIGYRDFHEEP